MTRQYHAVRTFILMRVIFSCKPDVFHTIIKKKKKNDTELGKKNHDKDSWKQSEQGKINKIKIVCTKRKKLTWYSEGYRYCNFVQRACIRHSAVTVKMNIYFAINYLRDPFAFDKKIYVHRNSHHCYNSLNVIGETKNKRMYGQNLKLLD